jgi:DNA-binding response OmpR family regulator
MAGAAAVVVKGGRILVIDDDPMVRDTLGQLLADEGYVVDAAIDGMDALDRLRSARPDAILLDLMMPGMNGRQFLSALRTEPSYASVPVLIMTAVHGLNVNLSAIGASEVVEKPFDPDELLNKVALAVYRSRDADRVTHAPYPVAVEPTPEPPDRGVVLVVEHDRARLQQLDVLLSARGYTVVSMTRALVQLARLARALRPRAILVELASEGVKDVVRELREDNALDAIPLLVFARGAAAAAAPIGDTLERAADADLVAFVDKQR